MAIDDVSSKPGSTPIERDMAAASDVYFPFVPRRNTEAGVKQKRQRKRLSGKKLLRFGKWGSTVGFLGLIVGNFLTNVSYRTETAGFVIHYSSLNIALISLFIVLIGIGAQRSEKTVK